jgi:2-C-methyl-D-erythritol 4-phosphate cytidylyltransferase
MGASVPKVLLPMPGGALGTSNSILQRTVRTFAGDDACERIVVCVPAEWREEFSRCLTDFAKVSLVNGGATRQISVQLGVEALNEAAKTSGEDPARMCVLVHDAARCCVSREVLHRVVAGVRAHGAVTAGVPVPDTLTKVVDGVVRSVVDREDVWAVQTPQGFLLEDLRSAHYAAAVDNFVGTDDASVVARMRPVHMVLGDRLNIKVTHPHDLEVVARIDASRMEEQRGE